jgi:hypothetical protein
MARHAQYYISVHHMDLLRFESIRDLHEAYQAETEVSGSETEAFVNRFEARPRRVQQKYKLSLVPPKDYKSVH